ncbi:uncharacterized protein [Dendropsophus ebraccatus]|uniref:uncharacterized protein n=1 Tax=Dendropsophus ebraccatus TaxID=150705 RepID=UPI003831886C
MRRRRRRGRGGANCGRALNAGKALTPENTGLAGVSLENTGQLITQEERKEKTCMNWHFRRQDTDEVKGLKRHRTWKTRKGPQPNADPTIKLLPSKVKSRLRNTRFSNVENMTLVTKLVPVYEQLLGKYKSRTPFLKKCQMWQEICDGVNHAGNKQRLVHHCKKRFSDIKRKLRSKLNQEKSLLGDQAGPSAFKIYYTQYEEELKKALPAEVIDGIEFFDSDHPQELCSGEEAGPLWCTQQNGHRFPVRRKGLQELPNTSKPQEIRRPLYTEEWAMLPGLGIRMETSPVRSMNFSTDPMDLQPGHNVGTRHAKCHPTGYPIEEPSMPCVPNLIPKPGAHLLKTLQASQKQFRKSMKHSLNVLHSDVSHFNKCVDESNSIADNLLRVESERNNILHQMNVQLGKLADSVEQLANQQHAELHDYPRRQNPSRTLYTSIRGGRGGTCRLGK